MGKDEGKRLSHLLVLTLRYAASSTHVTCEWHLMERYVAEKRKHTHTHTIDYPNSSSN
jgi:hypothetical protein